VEPELGCWQQNWMDDTGGVTNFTDGRWDGTKLVFVADKKDAAGKPVKNRLSFFALGPTRCASSASSRATAARPGPSSTTSTTCAGSRERTVRGLARPSRRDRVVADGPHTGRTDMPLEPEGEAQAARLGARLHGPHVRRGLDLAARARAPHRRDRGFGPRAKVVEDLAEWNYGEFEGLRRAEIQGFAADWDVFRDGAPGGESDDEARPAPIAWWRGCAPPRATCSCSGTGTSSGRSAHAGSTCRSRSARGCCCRPRR
jgi:hypothetical protein